MKSVIAIFRQRGPQGGRRLRLAALAAGLLLAATGCSTGAYPIDFFSEMHYQQSFRSQERPRLDPPQGSVVKDHTLKPDEALTLTAQQMARENVPVDLGTGATMKNPLNRTPQNLEAGQKLFSVNCAPCHGAQGKGDGPLVKPVDYFKAVGPQVPIDFTSPRGLLWNEGQLFSIITNGQPPGYFDNPNAKMPTFGHLLTPDERWLIVTAVQQIQGR